MLSQMILILLFLSSLSSNMGYVYTYSDNVVIYVGGSGEGNYSSIQQAIDNASSGDTIFVYHGLYVEHLVVDKTISLIGEDSKTTIIDGDNTGSVISIYSNNISIRGFTIRNSGIGFAGVSIYSNSNNISHNIITLNLGRGIYISSDRNKIEYNVISKNYDGLYIFDSKENFICFNTVSDNSYYGIYVSKYSMNNSFYENNLIRNGQHAHDAGVNIWDDGWHGNYWDDYKERYPEARKILLKGIWSIPYEIPGNGDQDNCPLIKPYSERSSRIYENRIHEKIVLVAGGIR